MGSSHCFPCLEASFWTSESMAFRIAGSGTMLDSYLEPPSFTEESRWPHQGRSRKTCPALSDKQSIPTHGVRGDARGRDGGASGERDLSVRDLWVRAPEAALPR